MTNPLYTETEIVLEIPGKKPKRLRTPTRLAEAPALLINLASRRERTLNDPPYCVCSDIFLAAGHRVASFDLPNHGDNVNQYGSELSGIAAALVAGADPFGEIRATGKSLVDAVIAQNLTRAGRIVVAGTSRGGLSAMHLMASDRRILAGAAFAPVTHLPALTEFAALADFPLAQRNSAEGLLDELAGRPMFLTMNTNDARVSTAQFLKFHAALIARDSAARVELFMTPGDTHAVAEAGYWRGAAFLLSLL